MEVPEYPPNSEASKKPQDAKNFKRVTSEEPTLRKRPLRKKFSNTFVAGDPKSALQYVMLDVLIPAARDMIADTGRGLIEKIIYGDSSRYRGNTPPQSGPTGYVTYNRFAMGNRQSGPQRAMSRQARARHDFDEIVLSERSEAEDVIDNLFEAVSRYGSVSVADLYTLVGASSTHVDTKWGWTNLRGAGVSRVRGGYLLDLPEPEPLE